MAIRQLGYDRLTDPQLGERTHERSVGTPQHAVAAGQLVFGGEGLQQLAGMAQALAPHRNQLAGVQGPQALLVTAESPPFALHLQAHHLSQMASLLPQAGGGFDFVLADLGVSSMQIDLAERGFCGIAPKHYLDDPRKVERAFDRLGEIERAYDAPYCIVLGDCHQGNTYILPEGERLWLDWQLVRRGRPWRDLTYFVIGALTIEERRKHHKDLVKQYRDYLIATGVAGVPSFEEAWEQTRLWVMYGVQAWVANLDAWGQNGIPMNERFFVAAEDYGTWGLLGE